MNIQTVVYPERSREIKHGIILSDRLTGQYYYEGYDAENNETVFVGNATSEHGARTRAGIRKALYEKKYND